MRSLDRHRIAVDFNELVETDVVVLSRVDSREDSAGELIALREGLRVYLYMEDADAQGAARNLLATGIIERHDASHSSASVKWRCRIDRWES